MKICSWLNHSNLRLSIPLNLLHSNTFLQPEMIILINKEKKLNIIEAHNHTCKKYHFTQL